MLFREVVSVFFFHSACKIISRIPLKLGEPRKSMNKAARAARDELHLRGMEDRYVEAAIGKKGGKLAQVLNLGVYLSSFKQRWGFFASDYKW